MALNPLINSHNVRQKQACNWGGGPLMNRVQRERERKRELATAHMVGDWDFELLPFFFLWRRRALGRNKGLHWHCSREQWQGTQEGPFDDQSLTHVLLFFFIFFGLIFVSCLDQSLSSVMQMLDRNNKEQFCVRVVLIARKMIAHHLWIHGETP